jgi:hypothetical protein
MLLVLTSSDDATASFLLPILDGHGVKFARINTDSLAATTSILYRVGSAAIRLGERWLEPDAISNVWYRRPEPLKDDRFDKSPEGGYTLAEWTACVEGFFAHIPKHRWVNHPANNAMASHKMEQLTTAQTLGFNVPATLVTQDPEAARSFYCEHNRAIIIKPMASGYIERNDEEYDSLIYTNRIRPEDLEHLHELAACPTLFQQSIEKYCDVRITVMDSDIHAVALFASDNEGYQRCDIRRNNMADVRYETADLPTCVIAAINKLMKHYGLRFGAIDMAMSVTGEWYFFEINPNGQWAWLDMCAGSNIAASFVKSFAEV